MDWLEQTFGVAKLKSISREKLLKMAVFLSVAFGAALLLNARPDISAYLLIIALTVFALLTWLLAGIAVFKPLFLVSAELSLMIFLAQSYCEVTPITRASDEALKVLLAFGLLYVSFLFLKSLDKELKGKLNLLSKINGGGRPWLAVIFFAAFVGVFLWQFYQVIAPIVRSLCIYHR